LPAGRQTKVARRQTRDVNLVIVDRRHLTFRL